MRRKIFQQQFRTLGIDNPIWRYKALRLLAERSRLFWQMPNSKTCFKPLKIYLESTRDRIKKEMAEWQAFQGDKPAEPADVIANDDEEEEPTEEQSTADTQEPPTEKKDPMKEALTPQDIANLAKLVPEEHWEVFSLRTLRLRNREHREIKADTEDKIDRIKMCIGAWQDDNLEHPEKITREMLQSSIKKTPQLAGKLDAKDWVDADLS